MAYYPGGSITLGMRGILHCRDHVIRRGNVYLIVAENRPSPAWNVSKLVQRISIAQKHLVLGVQDQGFATGQFQALANSG
jgi:hypothetical protein